MRKKNYGNGRSDEPVASRQRFGIGGRDGSGSAKHSSSVIPSEELQRLRRGELTEEQYLEARIAQATLHLGGRVSGRKIERIRTTLKRVCASDPVILAMKERVLRAKAKTGSSG